LVVSIFNFHYAAPPDTIAMNWELKKLIGDNETGFRGTNNLPYRTEAWDFILAGGALIVAGGLIVSFWKSAA